MMPYPLEQLNDGTIVDHNFKALARDMNPPVPQARVYNSAAISINDRTSKRSSRSTPSATTKAACIQRVRTRVGSPRRSRACIRSGRLSR
jgi:hypothetical protein